MIRSAALLLLICSLAANSASTPPEAAERLSSPTRLQRRALKLRRGETVTLAQTSGPKKVRLPDSQWDTRRVSKSGEPDKDCLMRGGAEIACVPGRFNSLFSSADGSRHVFLSMTGFMTPQVFKRLLFVTGDGKQVKEILISNGGIPILAAATKGNLLAMLFQHSGGASLSAYDFDGRLLWEKIIPNVRVATNDQRMLRVTSDGRRIIVSTNRIYLKEGSGKTVVVDSKGEVRTELPQGDALSVIAPDESWAAVWTKDELQLLDLATDRARPLLAFATEEGTTLSVEDISSDSKRILIAKRRRNDPKTGAKPRVSQLMVLDSVSETVSESEVDEEMDVAASCRFSGIDGIEITSRERRTRYAVLP